MVTQGLRVHMGHKIDLSLLTPAAETGCGMTPEQFPTYNFLSPVLTTQTTSTFAGA